MELMTRSGEDRFRMACSMREAAKRLIVASVLEQNPQATAVDIRKALFSRFYGNEFDRTKREKILRALECVDTENIGNNPLAPFSKGELPT